MNSDQRAQFAAMADGLGHDPAALAAGAEERTLLRLDNLEQARALVRVSEDARIQRREVFSASQACRDDAFWQRFDKAMAYVFGNGELTPADRFFCDRLFPMDVTAISVDDKVLPSNSVWDLGTSTTPVIVNIGTLTMEPGSRIVIRNTVLRLNCQTLIRHTTGGVARAEFPRAASAHFAYLTSSNYDIGVLGVNPDTRMWLQLDKEPYAGDLDQGRVSAQLVQAFAAANLPLSQDARVYVMSSGGAWRILDAARGRTYSLVVDPNASDRIDVFQLAMQGSQGGDGGEGGKGTDGTCTCSGTEPGNAGTRGLNGTPGSEGGQGDLASDGLPALRADISIHDLQGHLVILTQGGDGAQGGKGGQGGAGGKGGQGGYGSRCAATCDDGGDGGAGGTGGKGGQGGQGGNGSDAFDIFVSVPPAQAQQVTGVVLASNPGQPGPGGDAGAGGAGGSAGGASMYCHGGSDGSQGEPGSPGAHGDAGKQGGLAGRIIINGMG